MLTTGKKRRVLLNLLALLIGLLLIAALEGVLRLSGVQPYSQIMRMRLLDNFVRNMCDRPVGGRFWSGPSLGARVFSLRTNASGQDYYAASSALSGILINAQSFPAKKRQSTCRIFCFGASTTYGFPYPEMIHLFWKFSP